MRIYKSIYKNLRVLPVAAIVTLVSCTGIPDQFTETGKLPDIFPDIVDITVPVNIAPLNFRLNDSPEKVFVLIEGKNGFIRTGGKTSIKIPVKKWNGLLEQNKGEELNITVYSKQSGEWSKHKPFSVFVNETPVDPYLVYRRIAPGYESWSKMGIYQRNLSNFDEDPVIDNTMLTGNCMNCHSFSGNNPERMMLHLRGKIGGTLIADNGEVVKLDTRTEETKYNCVYPYWHPSGSYIAYSVNNISQVFHSVSDKRVEVVDSESDLVVYDISSNKLITDSLVSLEGSFETFPAFSSDGNHLYFCSAKRRTVPADYDKIRYSLCRIGFDPASGTFGDRVDTLVSSGSTGKSISFPRASPDGKYLMFTMSDYGNFSIWHREADLYILDLGDGTYRPLDQVNSEETESYHSWSSESGWFVFSSRRIDGLYTRLYISGIDETGTVSKPFLLPQENPEYYDLSLFSFNVPEFVTGRVMYDVRNMKKAIDSDPENVIFEIRE